MAFTLNKNFFFIDSMLLMNSNLDKLVKNLTDKKFKENKLTDKDKFFSSLKSCGINEKEYQKVDKV